MTEHKPKLNKRGIFLFLAVFLAAGVLIGWLLFHPKDRGQEEPAAVAVLQPDAADGSSILVVENRSGLEISEVMHHNSAFLADEDGSFPDWIEVANRSGSPVSLKDCILSDKQGGSWCFPEVSLEPDSFLLVFADGKNLSSEDGLHADFSLSDGEEITLRSPAGQLLDRFTCLPCENDCSLIKTGGQTPEICLWPTPGFANTKDGYLLYQMALPARTDLFISEVKVDGSDYWETHDFIELCNGSDSAVDLRRYYLSDDPDDLRQWQLPARTLEPGETVCFLCGAEDEPDCVPFSLGSDYEHLYLSDKDGLRDHLSIRNVPPGATMGRSPVLPGTYYYDTATPGEPNGNGYRRVSQAPAADSPDGVYDGTDEVVVTLSAPGTIYYTLDCSDPLTSGTVYTEPIRLTSTTVVRTAAREFGMMDSPVRTLSYIINENHSLPVLSLVGADPDKLEDLKDDWKKKPEITGSLSLYENSGSFTVNCGITLSGNTSMRLPYKSFKVHFRSCYGDSRLEYDLFGSGITEFDSLTLRKGQDNGRMVFSCEMWEDLARSMSDSVIVQSSKFCVLYVNGEYYGITSLREDFSKQFYASRAGVPKETVERDSIPLEAKTSPFYADPFAYLISHRTLNDEDYAYLSSRIDMDSLIDWIILEGVSGNYDLHNNAAFFRSSAGDGKWHVAFFDLDTAFKTPFQGVLGMTTFASPEMTMMLTQLMDYEPFVQQLLARYAEVYDTWLSNNAILSAMEKYKALLSPEMDRDRAFWKLDIREWYRRVEKEEDNIVSWNWSQRAVRALFTYAHLSMEDYNKYFPELGAWNPSSGLTETDIPIPEGDGSGEGSLITDEGGIISDPPDPGSGGSDPGPQDENNA